MTKQKTTTKDHNKKIEDKMKADLARLRHNTTLCRRLMATIESQSQNIETSRISIISNKRKRLKTIIDNRNTLEKLDNTTLRKRQLKDYNELVNKLDTAIKNYKEALDTRYYSLFNEREENIKKMKQDDFNKRKELVLNTNSKNTVEHEILKVESDIRRKKNIGKYREELIELQEYLERLNILYNALEC